MRLDTDEAIGLVALHRTSAIGLYFARVQLVANGAIVGEIDAFAWRFDGERLQLEMNATARAWAHRPRRAA